MLSGRLLYSCPFWLVKASGEQVQGPLVDIIKQSFERGLPSEFKGYSNRAAPKKKTLDPSDPVSYRLVSNLLFLGKVTEEATAEQFQTFLNHTLVLDPFHSGFSSSHGTETALVALTDDLHKQLDQGVLVLLILLDLTAVFDVVDYDLFAHRLANVGIDGVTLQWLTSFLRGQGQRVTLGEKSTRHPLASEMPQGAILFPVLSNIYMCPPAQLARSFRLGYH